MSGQIYPAVRAAVGRQISARFPQYSMAVRSVSPEMNGLILDLAIEYRDAFIADKRSTPEMRLAFNQPAKIRPEALVAFLTFLFEEIDTLHDKDDPLSNTKKGVMQVWIFSAGAIAFQEHRREGILMWKELSRGFPYCKRFNPENDLVEGLQPCDEIALEQMGVGKVPPSAPRPMPKVVRILAILVGLFLGWALYRLTNK